MIISAGTSNQSVGLRMERKPGFPYWTAGFFLSGLEQRRMEKARHLLLTTGLPVQEVGRVLGFPNAQHFSIRFRKMTGQSPSAFRQAPRLRFRELSGENGKIG